MVGVPRIGRVDVSLGFSSFPPVVVTISGGEGETVSYILSPTEADALAKKLLATARRARAFACEQRAEIMPQPALLGG